MFSKIFRYAGPYKTKTILSGVVILLAVVFQVLPFLFVYRIIAPLIMGETMDVSHIAVCVDVYKRQERRCLSAPIFLSSR